VLGAVAGRQQHFSGVGGGDVPSRRRYVLPMGVSLVGTKRKRLELGGGQDVSRRAGDMIDGARNGALGGASRDIDGPVLGERGNALGGPSRKLGPLLL
jgi:hypothetical protein